MRGGGSEGSAVKDGESGSSEEEESVKKGEWISVNVACMTAVCVFILHVFSLIGWIKERSSYIVTEIGVKEMLC